MPGIDGCVFVGPLAVCPIVATCPGRLRVKRRTGSEAAPERIFALNRDVKPLSAWKPYGPVFR
jgi:hypothetical protein